MSKKLYVMAHHQTSSGIYSRQTNGYADYHKIGVATKPRRRMSVMGSGTPHELKLTTTIECDDAEAVESTLHRIYSGNKYKNEWFRLDQNAINSLDALEYLSVETLSDVEKYRRKVGFRPCGSLYVDVHKAREGELRY